MVHCTTISYHLYQCRLVHHKILHAKVGKGGIKIFNNFQINAITEQILIFPSFTRKLYSFSRLLRFLSLGQVKKYLYIE